MAAAIPYIPVALAAVGTLMSSSGSKKEAAAQAQANAYNAGVALRNAEALRAETAVDVVQVRRASAGQLGEMRAGFAASGFQSGGSVMDVLMDSAAQAELEAQTMTYKGELRAQGLEAQAGLDTLSASNALKSGSNRATGILISGATKAYGSFPSSGGTTPTPTPKK